MASRMWITLNARSRPLDRGVGEGVDEVTCREPVIARGRPGEVADDRPPSGATRTG